MNNEAMKEVLNELFSHLERLEAQNEAILQFLKEKKRVTDKQLAPYLEQAGNASSVKWRAARVRIDHLLEPEHPEKEMKLGKKPELHEDSSRADSSDADSIAALAGDKRTESSGKDGKSAEPGDTGLQDKEKPAAAEVPQARPANGKADKPEEKSESEQKMGEQDQHEQKSDSVRHPTEVTEPLPQKESAEPAAQLRSDKTKRRRRHSLGFSNTSALAFGEGAFHCEALRYSFMLHKPARRTRSCLLRDSTSPHSGLGCVGFTLEVAGR